MADTDMTPNEEVKNEPIEQVEGEIMTAEQTHSRSLELRSVEDVGRCRMSVTASSQCTAVFCTP
jgi:hypothetical protein